MRVTLPSARNLEIFHRVVEDGVSLREVANEFDLSHNRVAEICQQVRHWRKNVVPEWEEGRQRRQDSVAACRIHHDRQAHLYSVMMTAWRNSTQRRTENGASSTIVTTPGDIKYIAQAMRCSREQMHASLVIAKLPDEFFDAEKAEVEVVPMTDAELAQEAAEMDRCEARHQAQHKARSREAMKRLQALAAKAARQRERMDQEFDDARAKAQAATEPAEPPVSVLTAAPAENAETAAPPAATVRLTPASDATSDVGEILRQQARHDRRKKISPVQPTAANEEKRRELAAKLFGT